MEHLNQNCFESEQNNIWFKDDEHKEKYYQNFEDNDAKLLNNMEQILKFKYIDIVEQKKHKIKAIDVILNQLKRKNKLICDALNLPLNKIAEEPHQKTIFDADPAYVPLNILEE